MTICNVLLHILFYFRNIKQLLYNDTYIIEVNHLTTVLALTIHCHDQKITRELKKIKVLIFKF